MPPPSPEVVRETAASLVIDGRDGHGHYTARWGMGRLLEKGRGTGDLPRRLPPHPAHGAAREYAEMAAREGSSASSSTAAAAPARFPTGRGRGPGNQPDRRGDSHRGGPALRARLRHQQDRHQQGPARPQPRPAPARPLDRRPGTATPATTRKPTSTAETCPASAATRDTHCRLLVGLLCGLSGDHEAGEGAHRRPRHAGDERREHDAAGPLPGKPRGPFSTASSRRPRPPASTR